jgi:hypothetical protein
MLKNQDNDLLLGNGHYLATSTQIVSAQIGVELKINQGEIKDSLQRKVRIIWLLFL